MLGTERSAFFPFSQKEVVRTSQSRVENSTSGKAFMSREGRVEAILDVLAGEAGADG